MNETLNNAETFIHDVSGSALYLGDCLEIMNNIPNNSVDFICCDLPYGMTAPKWDEHIGMVELWKHYNRIIKKDATIALFASQPFTTKLIVSNEKDFRYCWYWVKNQGTNFITQNECLLERLKRYVFSKKVNTTHK